MVVGESVSSTDVCIIGAGPGGYVAAIRAAQLGKQVVVVDKLGKEGIGGVCLHAGCIPSKALIYAANFGTEIIEAKKMGINAQGVTIDVVKMQAWKESVVQQLTNGIEFLFKKHEIEFIQGAAGFENSNTVRVISEHGTQTIECKKAIIATGSVPVELPELKSVEAYLMDSTEALSLKAIPRETVILGAGYIAVELGIVLAKLGSKVHMVQRSEKILSLVPDEEITNVLHKRMAELGIVIHTSSKIVEVKEGKSKAGVVIENPHEGKLELPADKILVAMGRTPYLEGLGLQNTKVRLNEKGFITIDERLQTTDKNILAIGDCTGNPMLAHRAFRQGKVCAEVIAGLPAAYDNRVVPGVVFGDPEIAYVGLFESEAIAQGMDVVVGRFPFQALGKALATNKPRGLVKIVAEKKTQLLLGAQIIGEDAGNLISELALATEMGAQLEDLAATIHPHPTMPEAIMEAAEEAMGKAIHVLGKKEK